MSVNKSALMRTPAVGMVPSKATIDVKIERALEPHELPIVITRTPGTAVVTVVNPNTARIENKAVTPTAYIMLIAPKGAVSLAQMPWRDAVKLLSGPMGRALLWEKFSRWLNNAP